MTSEAYFEELSLIVIALDRHERYYRMNPMYNQWWA
jgi:hypothetical protein